MMLYETTKPTTEQLSYQPRNLKNRVLYSTLVLMADCVITSQRDDPSVSLNDSFRRIHQKIATMGIRQFQKGSKTFRGLDILEIRQASKDRQRWLVKGEMATWL
jgi:hypothetical protein